MTGLTRRSVIRAAMLTSAAAALAQSGTARAANESAAEFRIATWGGSWRDSVAKNIVAKMDLHGGAEDYVLGNPEDNLAKLVAAHRGGQIPFDVMECNPDQTSMLTTSGLFETLDYGKLPNAKAMPAWARDKCVVFTAASEDGIVYNEEKFSKAGIAPPKSYLDLQDPKLAGKVAFPDISHPQHWNAVVGLAMLAGGSEANMAPALKLVNEIKPAYFYAASTDLATRFGTGDIWAAPWMAGWAVRLKRSGVPIAITYPDFGGRIGALHPFSVGIVKGTPQLDEAYAFIDAYLSPDAGAAHCVATGSLPLNPLARSALAQDSVSRSLMILSDNGVENMFQIDWPRFDVRKWRDAWNRGVDR